VLSLQVRWTIVLVWLNEVAVEAPCKLLAAAHRTGLQLNKKVIFHSYN
jgi:hypothetical protein